MRALTALTVLLFLQAVICAEAVEFKLGEFDIKMAPPVSVDHIDHEGHTYSDYEIDKVFFTSDSIRYIVTVLKPLSGPVEKFKNGYPGALSNTTIDGKSAILVSSGQFTTVEYVKDDNALITLQFEEVGKTERSDSITETITNFKARRR